MIHDLQQQKEDIEKVIEARERRILDHKMAITVERSLIKSDQNTVDVINRLLEKIGPTSEAEAPCITTDGREL